MSDENYKARLREFIERRGQKVELHDSPWGDEPEPSTYGWVDYDATEHIALGCHWIVPEGSVLTEKTYDQFQDTFSGNNNEVGLNVSGAHCACSRYTDVVLRYRGSFEDVLMSVLGGKGDRPHLVL